MINKVCDCPENILCNCHLKNIFYEDENGDTKFSNYKYPSLDVFENKMASFQVDLSKMKNLRWGND